MEQGSKASQKAQKRTASSEKAPASRRSPVGRHQVAFWTVKKACQDASCETALHCGTDRAFEGQLVVAPLAPELLASEGEQAAADASLSRAPPSAMATAGAICLRDLDIGWIARAKGSAAMLPSLGRTLSC